MTKSKLTTIDLQRALKKDTGIVGRSKEKQIVLTLIGAHKNLLIEGPVGVGKTFLLQSICKHLNTTIHRVDGDARFTEQKLTGWFDPPSVLKNGYTKSSFIPGPLYTAMTEGGILFINELNRLPEGVQNILLPVLDEGILQIPHLKPVEAKSGFIVVATMNPREFVATTHISEALLDRFELLFLDYQPEADEIAIVSAKTKKIEIKPADMNSLIATAVSITRLTREHKHIKRGASVRAAISLVDYVCSGLALQNKGNWDSEIFAEACRIILPNRIELSDDGLEQGLEKVIDSLIEDVQKKN